MCGLAGYLRVNMNYPPSIAVKDMFLNTFITSQLRGFDSSGCSGLWVQNAKGFHTNKKKPKRGALTVKGLVDPKTSFDRLLDELEKVENRKSKGSNKYESPFLQAIIAHSRHATVGDVTHANAHPFAFFNNRFIGVHNGTVPNARHVFEELDRKQEPLAGTFEPSKAYGKHGEATDSEIILYCIYRYGIDAVYRLMEGAWALVWYDQRDDAIHFIRNGARTLWCAMDTITDSLYWSSEYDMLEFAYKRELHRSKTEKKHIWFFKPHHHYTVSLSHHRILQSNSEHFPWTSVTDLTKLQEKKYTPPAYANWYRGKKDDEEDNYDPLKPMTVERMSARQRINRRLDNMGSNHRPRETVVRGDKSVDIRISDTPKGLLPAPRKISQQDLEEINEEINTMSLTTCLSCEQEIEDPLNSNSYLMVKHEGKVCRHCLQDPDKIQEITNKYATASMDAAWTKAWMDATEALERQAEEELRKGGVNVH